VRERERERERDKEETKRMCTHTSDTEYNHWYSRHPLSAPSMLRTLPLSSLPLSSLPLCATHLNMCSLPLSSLPLCATHLNMCSLPLWLPPSMCYTPHYVIPPSLAPSLYVLYTSLCVPYMCTLPLCAVHIIKCSLYVHPPSM